MDDGYKYGVVGAPIVIAWAVGIALIAMAFLPMLLKGNKEAFKEMKEGTTFGTRFMT